MKLTTPTPPRTVAEAWRSRQSAKNRIIDVDESIKTLEEDVAELQTIIKTTQKDLLKMTQILETCARDTKTLVVKMVQDKQTLVQEELELEALDEGSFCHKIHQKTHKSS